MKKHMTQEVAIKSAWMILEGLGFSREINGDLEKTVTAVYESAPASDVVEVVRCRECEYRDYDDEYRDSEGELYGKNVAVCTGAMAYFNTPDDWYCKMGKRKDRGQEDG